MPHQQSTLQFRCQPLVAGENKQDLHPHGLWADHCLVGAGWLVSDQSTRLPQGATLGKLNIFTQNVFAEGGKLGTQMPEFKSQLCNLLAI